MTKYHYTTYRIGNLTLPDDVFLTPKQEKEIHARIQAALDRSMIEVLTGGNYVPALHETAKGTTIEHVRRPTSVISRE